MFLLMGSLFEIMVILSAGSKMTLGFTAEGKGQVIEKAKGFGGDGTAGKKELSDNQLQRAMDAIESKKARTSYFLRPTYTDCVVLTARV